MIHDVKRQFDKLHKVYYYQFDWSYHGAIVLDFKWYPTGKGELGYNLFYPQKYNPFSRKWKDVLRLADEDRQRLLSECQELWGDIKQVAPPKEGPEPIELEVEINGTWRDEAFCRTITKGPIKEWAAKNKFPVREK